MLDNLIKKTKKCDKPITKKRDIPDGIFYQCPKCKKSIYKLDLRQGAGVCPHCNYYYPVSPKNRINITVDKGSFRELDVNVTSVNPLDFPEYEDKIETYKYKTEQNEAVITGRAKIEGRNIIIAVMDSRFMMGSMGSAVGEKITRAIEYATVHKLPLIIFTASGGARMQEGILSLMQMAKTSSALAKHDDAGLLYVVVLTDPTTGGVTASFAMLGDIILAEEGALIGFAGRRVIEQTLKQKLPQDFQSAEFLLDHGMIDSVVKRDEIRTVLDRILRLHSKEDKK
ncbi:MAG: acetyl-CoA carboxylase, carboxyl transferase, beta subunit [Clostridiales bacterium]|jgi:acetyl-CoA carboxylase carboxyl transferase subunit beta|nr:acetyl-CoA carboxylase, carboxyl transferase, beta subunit [Clostridiales bacterium]